MSIIKHILLELDAAIRKVRKMTKLNPTTMKTQYDGQYDTFCRKNHDYGNSFEESLDKFGIIASLVRMQDKMFRLQSITDESKTQQVGSESLLDTLEDISNYAAMTACWLKGVQAEDDVINKNYIKENVDDCVNRIHQLQARGELPTIGGIEHYTYNIGRCAVDHYEDPYKIIEHIGHIQSFRSLDDKYAQVVIDSIKNYITDFNKEKESSKLTDEAYDFLEEQITNASWYISHIRAHGKIPQNKDICNYAYNIARYAMEQYPDPYRIVQHMGQILEMRSINSDDALLFCSRVTDCIRNMNTKDKARRNVIGPRGAGKDLQKIRSLMKELGVPKENIKEIFEDLEDEDDE